MTDYPTPVYTGPVLEPVTDTYLSTKQTDIGTLTSPQVSNETASRSVLLTYDQREVLWAILQYSLQELRRSDVQDEIPLLEDIIRQLRTTK